MRRSHVLMTLVCAGAISTAGLRATVEVIFNEIK
jgi:hypothetical protein